MNVAQEKLRRAWSGIFPDSNRNSGGPQFFPWIHQNATSAEEFDNMNKLYCGVSGSVVSPGAPHTNLKVQDLSGNVVRGKYYKCCWPCVCDIEKYARAEKLSLNLPKAGRLQRTALTIPDPCANANRIPKEVSAFQCENGKTLNAVQSSPGRIVAAILHGDGTCEPQDAGTTERCNQRKQLTSCDLASRGGMGDIFAKLACASDSSRKECKC